MFIAVCLDNYITLPYTIKSKRSIILRHNNNISSLLMLTFIHHSFTSSINQILVNQFFDFVGTGEGDDSLVLMARDEQQSFSNLTQNNLFDVLMMTRYGC